jgi:hypothetical protein
MQGLVNKVGDCIYIKKSRRLWSAAAAVSHYKQWRGILGNFHGHNVAQLDGVQQLVQPNEMWGQYLALISSRQTITILLD